MIGNFIIFINPAETEAVREAAADTYREQAEIRTREKDDELRRYQQLDPEEISYLEMPTWIVPSMIDRLHMVADLKAELKHRLIGEAALGLVERFESMISEDIDFDIANTPDDIAS